MNAKLHPKHDLVAVEVIDDSPDTIRGIVVPDRVKQNREAKAGKVLAVGPGRLSESGTWVPVTALVDDLVLFTKNAGVAVDPEGKVRLIRDCELLGTLVESPIIGVA